MIFLSDRKRPEFNRLLEDAEKKKFNIILCKTQSRFTRELELVEKYIHGDGKIAVLVNMSKGNNEVAKDVCMQIAAARPEYLNEASVPAERLESVADHTLQLIMLTSVITKELKIDIDYKKLRRRYV